MTLRINSLIFSDDWRREFVCVMNVFKDVCHVPAEQLMYGAKEAKTASQSCRPYMKDKTRGTVRPLVRTRLPAGDVHIQIIKYGITHETMRFN